MASFVALTVLFGFFAVFCCCLQLRGLGAPTETQASQRGLARLAAAAASAFVPAVLVTLVLTPLLSFAHVRELGRANAGGAGGRFVARLAKATLLAATVALLAGAVVQLGADGHLDRGRDDVARLNVK